MVVGDRGGTTIDIYTDQIAVYRCIIILNCC